MVSQLLTGVAVQVLVHAILEEVIVIEIQTVLEVLRVEPITAEEIFHPREVIGLLLLTAVKVRRSPYFNFH